MLSDDALRVYETPLAWLRGAGDGVVILDPRHAHHLIGVQRIYVGSAAFGTKLDGWLSKFLRPEIFVEVGERAAA